MSSIEQATNTASTANGAERRFTARSRMGEKVGSSPASPVQMRCHGLRKTYRKGSAGVPVLQGCDLEIHRGEFVSIIGQSGSGKSTLLHVLGTLDAPDAGEVWYEQTRIDNLAPRNRDAFRNGSLGMVFQFYHLLPELTALENVLAPALIRRSVLGWFSSRKQHVAEATALLEQVGLGHRLKHKPREMSGGEMQRAAIARALINRPQVLLADEPTGNLDQSTGAEIMQLLRSLNEQHNLTIVMVTHDVTVANQAHRTVRLTQGRIADI